MTTQNDLEVIMEFLGLNEEDLAAKLSIDRKTVSRWRRNEVDISARKLEDVYSFAFEHRIYLNRYKEMLLREEYEVDDEIVLFHGAKTVLDGDVDLVHSKRFNDFGCGFYLGESYEQAVTYNSLSSSHHVYGFKLNMKGLEIMRFSVSRNWMLAIAYYRGWIHISPDSAVFRDLIEKIEDADVIVAPIADNRMFGIINEFAQGEITDEQCEHALSATNLGLQYIIKKGKALRQLELLKELYVCSREIDFYRERRDELRNQSIDKARVARTQYRGKGKYLEEILYASTD